LAAGKAIVSTPYWHAQELLAGGRGRLVEFSDGDGFADSLRELLGDGEARNRVRKAAYDFGREMIWSRVGEHYREVFTHAKRVFAETGRDLVAERKILMRMSVPALRLNHLFTMTDDTGMLQHALYATPDRRHGYCTDDNARAMIVSAMAWTLFKDEAVLPKLHIFLSFLHFAYDTETGRFRNFMSYERQWLEKDGSDDCQGRALWALGYLVSHAPNDSTRQLAADLFRDALPAIETLCWPRSWALSILGLYYYLRQFDGDVEVRAPLTKLADQLNTAFVNKETDDWPWFEEVATYDNGRLPQALIIAGHQLERPDMVERGLRVLRWLLRAQTTAQGHLSSIGQDGWMPRGGERAQFDQQPLEPAALIGACKAAFRASGDAKWLVEIRRCFEWYLGRNDLGLSMIDFKSRGCYDGLTESGVNPNQGAESLLAWLLSLLIMHEMQTGDAPEVG
jgi:hypothetical protein